MKSTHRNQTTEPSSSVLEESLRVHGEAFMRMFDDSDEDEGEQAHAGAGAEATADRHSLPPLNGEQADVARRVRGRLLRREGVDQTAKVQELVRVLVVYVFQASSR